MNLFDLKVNTSRLQFSRDNFFEITPNTKGILVLNPPYDERLEMKDIELFYKDIGDMLKRHYTGFDVWIISANKAAMKKIHGVEYYNDGDWVESLTALVETKKGKLKLVDWHKHSLS